jgi:hypothetical protein
MIEMTDWGGKRDFGPLSKEAESSAFVQKKMKLQWKIITGVQRSDT